jgi:hypothetical protein
MRNRVVGSRVHVRARKTEEEKELSEALKRVVSSSDTWKYKTTPILSTWLSLVVFGSTASQDAGV